MDMKYIKRFNESIESIESICKKYGINNYTINEDGSIDVDGDVQLKVRGMIKLPIKFNKVSGNFNCSSNRLTSLEGSPKEVGGYFYCEENEITSLEGGPKKVGGDFYCADNQLTSLKGCPEGKYLNFIYNKLTSVRGLPEDFEGSLYIDGNLVYEIFRLLSGFRNDAFAKIAHLLNEYDVISQDGKKIYRDSLEEVFNLLGKEMPKDLKFYNYEIH